MQVSSKGRRPEKLLSPSRTCAVTPPNPMRRKLKTCYSKFRSFARGIAYYAAACMLRRIELLDCEVMGSIGSLCSVDLAVHASFLASALDKSKFLLGSSIIKNSKDNGTEQTNERILKEI